MTTSVLAAGSNNFLLPNATIIVEFLIFLAILFFFYRFVVPPLTRAMRERDEMMRKQAEERYETALGEARATAASIRDEARAAAQQIRDEMRAETDREVAEIRQRGEEQLAEQREQAMQQLRDDIGDLSVQLATRILGEQPPESVRRSTVDRFLRESIDETAKTAGGRT